MPVTKHITPANMAIMVGVQRFLHIVFKSPAQPMTITPCVHNNRLNTVR